MTVVALEATHHRVRSATLLAGAVFVFAALVAWWAGTPYVVGVWHDDGVYALLGRALATGQGFHYTQFPGAPAATHYPPLYPLLAALVWRLAPSFPDNISAFLLVNALLVGAAALGAAGFASRRFGWSRESAALFALLATLTTPVLALSGAVLSETLFLAALWPVLAAAERAADPAGERGDALVAGASVGALMLMRTHAVVLLMALVIVLVARRRRQQLLPLLAAAVIVVLPWQLWTSVATPRVPALLAGAYGSYLGWFVEGVREGGMPFVLATIRVNLRELWLLLQDRVVIGTTALPRMAAATLLLTLIVAGMPPMARRAAVTAWFLVLYFAVVVVWPYSPWRFLWGVWPVVTLSAVAGGLWLLHLVLAPLPRALVVLGVALPAAAMLGTEWRAYSVRAWSAPALEAGAQITPLVAWVGRHTAPTDVVLSEGEQVISLFTGRRAAPTASFSAREYLVPRSPAGSTVELRAMLATIPARYVLPLNPVQMAAAHALSQERPGLRAISALPHSMVFEVVR